MEPKYQDGTASIDRDAIKAYSSQLRRQAIEALGSKVFSRAAMIIARLRRSAAAHMHASAAPRLRDLR